MEIIVACVVSFVATALLGGKVILPALRRHKGHLQTVGLLCPEGQREELAELFLRCGLTRILRAGTMSDVFCGEAHDGEYPLRRYTRMVDIQ